MTTVAASSIGGSFGGGGGGNSCRIGLVAPVLKQTGQQLPVSITPTPISLPPEYIVTPRNRAPVNDVKKKNDVHSNELTAAFESSSSSASHMFNDTSIDRAEVDERQACQDLPLSALVIQSATAAATSSLNQPNRKDASHALFISSPSETPPMSTAAFSPMSVVTGSTPLSGVASPISPMTFASPTTNNNAATAGTIGAMLTYSLFDSQQSKPSSCAPRCEGVVVGSNNCSAPASEQQKRRYREPLRHLDLVGDPRSLVNFLAHWINRQCHWQSPGHAMCVRNRLAHIALFAKREQEQFLDNLSRGGTTPADLAHYAMLFGESQRTTQSLLDSLVGQQQSTSRGSSGAMQGSDLKRVRAVLIDFPTVVGAQYVARYLLTQPDWNAMSDDYKHIIMQSDFELMHDTDLITPDRMIAYMSRASLSSSLLSPA